MNRLAQVDKFIEAWSTAIEKVLQTHGSEYAFKADRIPHVTEKMRHALYEGSYNHDGRAIKAACKQLGIKHTRTAMEAFFNALDPDPLAAKTPEAETA